MGYCCDSILFRIKTIRHNPRVHLLVNAVVCTLSFAFSLPIALALFPQESKVSLNKVSWLQDDEIVVFISTMYNTINQLAHMRFMPNLYQH